MVIGGIQARHKLKVSWLAWEGMSMSKVRGGLGFKSLYGFNLALLEKQVWRYMNYPYMLVTRMLKARYFPNLHMLKAGKGLGSSYIWQSIWQLKRSWLRDLDGLWVMVEILWLPRIPD